MAIQKASELGEVEVLPTDTFLDTMTGLGGLPCGVFIEFFGVNNSGKSTAALHAIKAAIDEGHKTLLIDSEYAFSAPYAESMGVSLDKLDVMHEPVAEKIFDDLEEVVRKGTYKVIVLDSLGQLSSRLWFEKSSGEKTIGVQSSLIKQFLEKNVSYIHSNKILFIGISHERKDMEWGKIFSLGGNKWAEKKKLSIRFREKGTFIKRGETVVGKEIIAKVVKNHLAGTEGMEMTVPLLHDRGFAADANLAMIAEQKGVITKAGQFYMFKGEKIARGKAALMEALKDEELQARVKAAL